MSGTEFSPQSPLMPGQPTLPSSEPETSAGYNVLEAIRSAEKGRGGYPGDTWLENLLSPETNQPEKIPFAMRYAAAMVLENEMRMIADRSKWSQEPHLYHTQDIERRLGAQRLVWTHQLNKEVVSQTGLKIPPRTEIPIIDEETGTQKYIYVVTEIPLYYPDGRPVTDKDGQPKNRRESQKKYLGVPASDEQLEASIISAENIEMWLNAWYWMTRDMVMERKLDNDIEQLSESFGRYWRDNPTLEKVQFILSRPELVPGKDTEANMLQRGLDAFDKIGHMPDKSQGKGPRNIFFLDFSGERLETAINFAAAQVMGKRVDQLPQDDKQRTRDLDYLHAKAIAHEALGLAHYLGIDEEYAVVSTGEFVKRGDLLNRRVGDPPGTPVLKIEVGRLTTTDRIKARHMAVRLRNELDHDCPFSVGSARFIARAMPNISLPGLALISTLRTNGDGAEQRLSFNQLKRMGVKYQEMPWIAEEWKGATVNGRWVDAHDFFDIAYGITRGGDLSMSYRELGFPAGPRADGKSVPWSLQEQYVANLVWVPLTDKDVAGLFKTFSEASRLEGANKGLYLGFTFLSGDLLIDRKETIYKFIQYVKVLRLAAAEMAVTTTPNKDNEITYPLSRSTDVAGEIIEGPVIKDRLLNAAINAVYFSPLKKSLTGPGGRYNARNAEVDLFKMIVGGRNPIPPAKTGWFDLSELVRLSKLYPYGVGYTQGDLYLLLQSRKLSLPHAKMLGYTGVFDQQELEYMVSSKQISRLESNELLSRRITRAETQQAIRGQAVGQKPFKYCIWRQEDF